MKKINTNKKGFTIIEVVLVLAIAGLIFMMVFIALPALQRSQRDTQRSNDIGRVQTALNQYQANNRGAIPTVGNYIKGHETPSTTSSNTKSWEYFYDKYLIVNSAGAQDVFADPDGEPYSLWIQECEKTPATETAAASNQCKNGQRFDVTFDNQSAGTTDSSENTVSGNGAPTSGTAGHTISILYHATCQGEVAYYSSGSRKVAILYKKEGGGTFCLNN